MQRLIPRLLGTDDLPAAELRAARLDGLVYPVAGLFAAVDEPDTGWLRATALALSVPARTIVERGTALWLHGIHAQPPLRHQLCVAADRRSAPPPSTAYELRECVIGHGDVVSVGPLQVTSPFRTAVDLLRMPGAFSDDDAADVSAVLQLAGTGVDDCVRRLRATSRTPGTSRALERVAFVERVRRAVSPR